MADKPGMKRPVHIPGLFICQPAIIAPAQFEFALGVQHLWATELGKLGVNCRPTVYSRPHPEDAARRQPIVHHTPYALESIEELNRDQLPAMPRMALQSQVLVANDPLCHGHARLGNIPRREYLEDMQAVGGLAVLLRWVYEVIDDVAVALGRPAPSLRWQAHCETADAQEAAVEINMRGAFVRELLGLEAEPILDEHARNEPRPLLN